MTVVGWLQIAVVLVLVIAAARLLGAFIVELFEGRRTVLSPVLGPVGAGSPIHFGPIELPFGP